MIRKAKWAPEVRFTLLCVLLICQRILFTNSVHYFKGWVEKHITINSMISFTVDTLIILDKLVPRALFSGFGVGAPLKAREKPPGDDVEFWKDFFLWQSSDCYVTLVSTKGERTSLDANGRHLIRSSWDSHGRDIGQLSYIIAQQGSSKESSLYGFSYIIMGYTTTISFRRLNNFKMKFTNWVGLDIRELCVFMEVNKRETSFICFWISWLG